MTIHQYNTAQRTLKPHSTNTAEQNGQGKTAFIHDIARGAVMRDEWLEPEEVNIEIDAMGNVIVKEHNSLLNGLYNNGKEKKTIHVPQAIAYQRILEATYKRAKVLEQFYEQSSLEAQQWFQRSFIHATLEAVIITLSLVIPLLIFALQLHALLVPTTITLIVISLLNGIVTFWIFHQAKQTNLHVDLYLTHLTEIRNFTTKAQFIDSLDVDQLQKVLLQKTMVSQSLGLTEKKLFTNISE